MTSSESRKKSLTLLRRRDRERALNSLDEALLQSDKIAIELEGVQRAIAGLNEQLESSLGSGSVSAARLQMQTDGVQVAKRSLRRQVNAKKRLEDSARKAAEQVARAKDALAKAQKAIAVLESVDDNE